MNATSSTAADSDDEIDAFFGIRPSSQSKANANSEANISIKIETSDQINDTSSNHASNSPIQSKSRNHNQSTTTIPIVKQEPRVQQSPNQSHTNFS
jgi:hypothetical protein